MGRATRQRGIRHRRAARRGTRSHRRPARPRSGWYIEVAAEVLGRTLFPRALPRPYGPIRRRARSVASSERVVQAGREVVDVVLESGVAGAWGGFPETALRGYEKAARVMVRVGRTAFGQGGPNASG